MYGNFLKNAISLGLLFSLCVLFGCEDDSTEELKYSPTTHFETLLAAPEELSIGEQKYTIQSFLWRDLMPPITPENSSLIALITISEKNLLDIPGNISLTYLWVVYGNQAWSTPFSEEPPPTEGAHKLIEIARGGPQWEPGTPVDVVVKIEDGAGGEYLLKAANQIISATY